VKKTCNKTGFKTRTPSAGVAFCKEDYSFEGDRSSRRIRENGEKRLRDGRELT